MTLLGKYFNSACSEALSLKRSENNEFEFGFLVGNTNGQITFFHSIFRKLRWNNYNELISKPYRSIFLQKCIKIFFFNVFSESGIHFTYVFDNIKEVCSVLWWSLCCNSPCFIILLCTHYELFQCFYPLISSVVLI